VVIVATVGSLLPFVENIAGEYLLAKAASDPNNGDGDLPFVVSIICFLLRFFPDGAVPLLEAKVGLM